MKKILLTLSCGLLAAQAFAQITLDVTNARTNPTGIDTMHNANPAGLPALNTATNVLWDFSTATYTPTLRSSPYAPVTGHPPATHGVMITFDLATNVPYTTQSLFSVNAQGILLHGEILNRQATRIHNVGDSLIAEAQTITYSSPKKVIEFPATINSSWTSDLKYNMALTLKYPTVPIYANVPSERRSHVTSKSTVIGWGRAKAKDLGNKVSTEMSVLLIQTADTTVDSFYMNGAPADPMALAQLQLSQGQQSYLYQRNLYRVNEITPLVSVTYTDANYTSVQDANVHRQRLVPASVKDLNLDNKVTIYPNPVSGKEVTIEIADAKAGNWTYEMTNMNGQKIATAQLNVQSGKAKINLGQDVTPGIYFVTLYHNGDLGAVKPLVIE